MDNWNLRYIQLHITVQWQEDGIVPVHKESAFRGSMGEYLLRQNCIADRKCEACSFEEDCIVRKIFYAKYKIVPPAVQTESAGFVMYCPDTRKQIRAGDRTTLELTLFGNVILYFSQILSALYAAGYHGIFSSQSKYEIKKITTRQGAEILQGNDIHMEQYNYEYLRDYITERMEALGYSPMQYEYQSLSPKPVLRLCFDSPAVLKYKNDLMKEFDEDTVTGVLNSIVRKVKMYLNYEGIPSPDYIVRADDYQYLAAQSQYITYFRHASTEKERQPLRGVTGSIDLKIQSAELLEYMLAGELLQIGKSTKFGMGKYHILW